MLRVANQIAAILRGAQGAEDVKVEQVAGLPFLEIKIDKAEIARLGLSLSAVQDVIGAAIGGREAGVVFEGDRRFPIVVRLNDQLRENLEALEEPASAVATFDSKWAGDRDFAQASRTLCDVGGTKSDLARKWQAARRRHGECARPRHCLAGGRGARKSRAKGSTPSRILGDLGRPVRKSCRRAAASDDRGARLLLLDLPAALYGSRQPARRDCSCSAPFPWR